MNDPVSDLLTRIRNASSARVAECVSPYSKLRENIALILKQAGYVQDVRTSVDDRGHRTLVIAMKYVSEVPAITGIVRVSKPGRRLYFGFDEIPRVLNGLGVAIVSTSKGIRTDLDCRRDRIGGEVICNVW